MSASHKRVVEMSKQTSDAAVEAMLASEQELENEKAKSSKLYGAMAGLIDESDTAMEAMYEARIAEHIAARTAAEERERAAIAAQGVAEAKVAAAEARATTAETVMAQAMNMHSLPDTGMARRMDVQDAKLDKLLQLEGEEHDAPNGAVVKITKRDRNKDIVEVMVTRE